MLPRATLLRELSSFDLMLEAVDQAMTDENRPVNIPAAIQMAQIKDRIQTHRNLLAIAGSDELAPDQI